MMTTRTMMMTKTTKMSKLSVKYIGEWRASILISVVVVVVSPHTMF